MHLSNWLTMLKLSPHFTPTPVTHLLHTLEQRDPIVFAHCLRVGRFAALVGARLGLTGDVQRQLETAGQLHDIGKLAIPPFLVHKEGVFTPTEYQIFKHHASLGAAILEEYQQDPWLIQTARQHHERWDGRGYPHGFRGNEISRFALITAVADAYDAMISGRSYRSLLLHQEALEEIQRCRGTQFSPEVVDAFLKTEFRSLEMQAG